MYPSFPSLIVKFKNFDPERVESDVSSCGGVVGGKIPERSSVYVHVQIGANPNDVHRALTDHPNTEQVEFCDAAFTHDGTYHAAVPAGMFNDTTRWYFNRMGVYHAWKHTRGDPGVLVVVIDSALQEWASTVDGPAQWYHPPRETRFENVRPDFEWNSISNISSAFFPRPLTGSEITLAGDQIHGQHVWWALVGDGKSTCIAPDCTFGFVSSIPSGVLGEITNWATSINDVGFYKAIEWANTYNKKVIISFSWRLAGFSTASYFQYQSASQYAINNGALIVNSVSNDGIPFVSATSWPAYDPRVLTVGSVYPPFNFGYGGYGGDVNLLGPAAVATRPSGSLNWGNSFTTPNVAACAALVWSANKDLTAAQVMSILKEEADVCLPTTASRPRLYMNSYDPGQSNYPNGGFVRVGRSVLRALSMASGNVGKVYPYIECRSLERRYTGYWDTVKSQMGSTVATTELEGRIEVKVSGYSSDPITQVQLKIGDQTVYTGAPTVLQLDLSTLSTGAFTVVCSTALTSTSETYTDVVHKQGSFSIGGVKFHPRETSRWYPTAPPYASVVEFPWRIDTRGYALKVALPRQDTTWGDSYPRGGKPATFDAITGTQVHHTWLRKRGALCLVSASNAYPVRIMTSQGKRAIADALTGSGAL